MRISDLIEAGWEFENAGLGSDGREWFESTKSFTSPDDLQKVLNELTNSPEAFKGGSSLQGSSANPEILQFPVLLILQMASIYLPMNR